MKYINIHNYKKKIIAKAIVDNSDYSWLSKFNWCMTANGYVNRKSNIKDKVLKRTSIYLHRSIMKPRKGLEVHHINENKLDNRKRNLKIISSKEHKKQSGYNVKPRGKVPYKGISIQKKTKKGNYYQAYIKINGEYVHLGSSYNLKKLYKEKYIPAHFKKYGKMPSVR
jgi:hypothetical protein